MLPRLGLFYKFSPRFTYFKKKAFHSCNIPWGKPPIRCDEPSRLVVPGYEKPVGYWLLGTSGLVFSLMCYGGYTRLTESGLSMTSWKLSGRKYPNTQEGWDKEFAQYKETLEYKQVHYGIQLDEFKKIYFNEWFHRMAARGIGVFFALGTIYFHLQRALMAPLSKRLATLLGLFLLQGLIGWWMVKSGFEERKEQYTAPRVSPYRLATHLAAATILYGTLVWTTARLLCPPLFIHQSHASCMAALRSRRWANLLLSLTPLTFVSGAFMAGNDAGRAFNTWPKMLDRWVPAEIVEVPNNFWHIFENIAVIQFNHRILGISTFLANSALLLYVLRRPFSPRFKTLVRCLAASTALQITLGITALLKAVPVSLGVLHQGAALLVVTLALLTFHALRVPCVI